MFRLYAGLVDRSGRWFNHAEVVPLKGGALAAMDTRDRTGAGRLLNTIKQIVPALYTESGEKMTLQEHGDLKVVDSWKIIMEFQKLFTGDEYHSFPENFFCSVCSGIGREKYTPITESWAMLMEKGFIDEVFLESPEHLQWTTVLPHGIIVEGNRQIKEGIFNEIVREYISLSDLVKIGHSNFANETDANMQYANLDAQIKEIVGLSERELNILKRNPSDSLSKKYIIEQDDVEAMRDQPEIGLSAEHRPVSCKHCNSEIGGHLDFTNFFSFLAEKKQSRPSTRSLMNA